MLSYADEIRTADGKKAISANYFMIAVLKTIDSVIHQFNIPDAIDNDEAREEFGAVRAKLSEYDFDIVEATKNIARDIRAEGYLSTMSEIIFRKMTFNLTMKANNEDVNADTLTYLDMIIKEPTAEIRKYILDGRPIPNKKDDTSSGSSSDFDIDIDAMRSRLRSLDEDLDEMDRESDFVDLDEDDGKSGMDKLADIVKKTKEIQNTLLKSVHGQDHAINAFVSGYFQARIMAHSRKNSARPAATFLFAGPPGVGKTFLAEQSADALGLPYRRFDMSEYSDKEANIEFCGSDQVYKNGKEGNVTKFVAENPECILLFDEVEKAHINVIHLFLQILDAGRIRDNYTDEEVSFSKAVIIFTTNAGKNLYDDPSNINLSALPKKKVLGALSQDINPVTKEPLFPAAICSRFASGNVVMFNHLEANHLYTIAKSELDKNVKGLEETIGIKINVDDKIPSALMFAEGGKADARTVKGRANTFFHEELYELFRLLSSDGVDAIKNLKEINLTIPMGALDENVRAMFESPRASSALVFADGALAEECKKKLDTHLECFVTDSIEKAKEILFNHDINVVLCDVKCGAKNGTDQLLNAEDIRSVGRDFMSYVLDKYSLPVYLLESNDGVFNKDEELSFAKLGVRDVLAVRSRGSKFVRQVLDKCEIAYRQHHMLKLARENKALSYSTVQSVSKNKQIATISLSGFHLSLITDTEDAKSIVDSVSRPDVHFDDVVGAQDAKDELKYFVEYLKDPIKYMRRGVSSPRGVLLYGPPGTGKTLLAKAMAGECGVTFLKAEGNQFLKRYVGEGAEAVHSLFNAARKYAPSIVFVDEIDAIGKDRSMRDSDDKTADVLTAFLTEMDGFSTDTSKPVFVLAATNYGVDPARGNALDAALLRRFDRRIYIDLPTKDERRRYLEMKLADSKNVKLSEDEIDNIAMRSTGMSLAELESVIELAIRSAIRLDSGIVGDAEFEEAFETFNNGEKKEWSEDGIERTARHESGHALVSWLSGDKPSYLTVVARADHGGYMQHGDNEGKGQYTKSELLARVRTALAGRAAEIVYYGDKEGISTGAAADLSTATRIAEQMICIYGMDESVGMSYIHDKSEMSQAIRDRVNAILCEELANAVKIIGEHRSAIDAMVKTLMDKNHLKGSEIDEIFSNSTNR